MPPSFAVAIETSCRLGGVALGRGDDLLAEEPFDASRRHATQLVGRLDALLRRHGLAPRDLGEVYVSAEWATLAIILDAGEGLAHTTLFQRAELAAAGTAASADPASSKIAAAPPGAADVLTPADFLAGAPRPILLAGEGLEFLGRHNFSAEGVVLWPADSPLNYPTAGNVWRAGRRLARSGRFTEPSALLPIYSRPPEAQRLWQIRHGA